ncbi:uncharacterized protein PAE49_006961 [Odontesthes bonariensis]|uniref:uncharacterized protein LOC142382705 n=1 Tax=Odontesthes bonariensis TaxID=219752 RepID=UPI003F58E7E2
MWKPAGGPRLAFSSVGPLAAVAAVTCLLAAGRLSSLADTRRSCRLQGARMFFSTYFRRLARERRAARHGGALPVRGCENHREVSPAETGAAAGHLGLQKRTTELKRREEDLKRREEDLKRREEEQNRREAEQKRREAEQNRREAEQNRRDEEQNRRDEEQNRRDEEQNRREEELKRREEAVEPRKRSSSNELLPPDM